MIGFYNYTVLLTYLGFSSGIVGILFAINQKPLGAVICLMIAGLCDAFDGRVARTKQRSDNEKKFGIQIDSLSDIVCFGVLPGIIGYCMGMKSPLHIAIIVLYMLAALIRLAFFNVLEENRSENEEKVYYGLPVTSAALLFPMCYGIRIFCRSLTPLYSIIMMFTGVAFITNFKMKKPSTKALLGFIGIGVFEIIFIILVLKGVIN